jgi:hypothetical protein
MRLSETTRDPNALMAEINTAAAQIVCAPVGNQKFEMVVEVSSKFYVWMAGELYQPNPLMKSSISVLDFINHNNLLTVSGRKLLWKIIRTCSRCECEIDSDGACGCDPPDA